MRKILFTLCLISPFSILSCSNDNNDIDEQPTTCLVDVVFDKMIPQYGECYRIINYDDFGAEVQKYIEDKYKNASTYEVMYNESLPVEGLDILYFLQELLHRTIELKHTSLNGKETTYTPIDNEIHFASGDEFVIRSAADAIYINEAGLEIICRCKDHNEKAKRIEQANNRQ